jgi:hypothetical protein
MARGTTQTNVILRVKRPEDMAKVTDQIHTLAKRLTAGSGVLITVVAEEAPKDTTAQDEQDLL